MSGRALLQLTRLLHPPRYRRRWLAVIQAYIDESGTHDQAKIIVMAGFLSSYKRWRKFDHQWDAILNPADEDPAPSERRVFHATDCLGANGYGHFLGWPKERRDRLVDRLIPVARARALFTFSAAFALEDYNAVVPERIRLAWKHPYYLCLFHIALVLKMNRPQFAFPAGERIAFVFAHKPKFVGLLSDLYDKLRQTKAVGDILGKMTPYGDPEEDLPIQAADLISYLTRTFWEKEHVEPGSAQRRTKELLSQILPFNLDFHFLTKSALAEFARLYGEVTSP